MASLSGRIRYRRNWRGKLILQVQVWQVRFGTGSVRPVMGSQWRDANWQDLLDIEGGRVIPEKPSPYPCSGREGAGYQPESTAGKPVSPPRNI